MSHDWYWDCATMREVLPLIAEHHYSRRRCADPVAVFCMRDDEFNPQAAAVFAAPANRYFALGIELVRLVRTRWIKRTRPEFLYCIAYADTDANHHGGIYQAASFGYIGLSNGHTMYKTQATHDLLGPVPSKIISARSRDQSSAQTKSRMTAIKTGPKHLYIFGLQTSTAHVIERLGRTRIRYPKPDIDQRPGASLVYKSP